jgi:hypothetical protein
LKKFKEIYIWGLSRCGNHALSEFILGHYYHTCPPNILSNRFNPNSKAQDRQFRLAKIFLNNYLNDSRYAIDAERYNLPPINKRIPFPSPKFGNVQIISYENGSDHTHANFVHAKNTDIINSPYKIFSDSGRTNVEKFALIILRDPFNMFASWKRGIEKIDKQKLSLERATNRLELWVKYAKTFYTTKNDKLNYMAIKFNKFVELQNYRILISTYITEPWTDTGIQNVSSMGSSFDRYLYDGKAQQMDVNNRYKYLTTEDLQLLYSIEELPELSKEIFGVLP